MVLKVSSIVLEFFEGVDAAPIELSRPGDLVSSGSIVDCCAQSSLYELFSFHSHGCFSIVQAA